MSDLKKVLTLVACGCICLMVATSASADFVGVKSVNKDDPATLEECTQAGGDFVTDPLTVCSLYAVFDLGTDKMLSIGNADLQVFNAGNPDVFYQHPFGNPFNAPTCVLLEVFPDLICDTFITIGWQCFGIPDFTTPDPDFNCDPAIPNLPPPDDECGDNPLQLDWFNEFGHVFGGWFSSSPPGGQGDAGQDPPNQNLQVLFLQSSVVLGLSMSGDLDIFWLDDDTGETIAEVGVAIECAAKCEPGACNDGNACTGPGPDGGPCPEGELCDECIDGTCSGGPVNCDDGNECTDNNCDPATGCVNNPVPNGTGCDDENPCTGPDTCTDGVCGGTGCMTNSDCDDGDDCTADVCDPGSGCCTNTPDCTSDADCDDGIGCTIDACDTGSGCCSNTPDDGDCDDGNPCTTDICSPDSGGCVNTPNDLLCDDGVNCTFPDTCSGGSCVGEDIECPIEGQSCNENNGQCEFCQTDDQCDDGQACNGSEICNPAEGCQAGADVDCSDLDDQCNVGVCTEPDGDCVQEPANEGGDCSDDNICTTGDACAGGGCVGDPVECPEGEVCDPNADENGDGIGDCVEVSDFLDITPGKCPNTLRRNGLGFVKISLLGTEDLDANDVDISSLLLARADGVGGSVAPRMTPRPKVRDRATPFLGELCDCHSRRKDGIDDLDMKFKLQEMVEAFELGDMPAGTEVRLELTGSTNDGQPIRAADCVILGRDLGPNP
ncbi:MAG: hypothetical protein IIB58_01145 [Planctomycetes bacterium]|nr:hypothetical protein [Planctomycetota bacterium]